MIGLQRAGVRRRPWRWLAGGAMALVLLSSAAAQYVAARFAYHPALGQPLFAHLYAPWAWVFWQARYRASAPAVFAPIQVAIAGITALGASLCFVVITARSRAAAKHEGVHGTAHWATREEIEETGLLPKLGQQGNGVYVGGWTDPRGQLHYLRHNGPEHIAAIAPTRSGKGVGLVVPTLLSWPHSVVVNDQKAELWNLSAGWRQGEAGNVALKFDPGAASGSATKTARDTLEELPRNDVKTSGGTPRMPDVTSLITTGTAYRTEATTPGTSSTGIR